MEIDFNHISGTKIHFTGIKGIAMAALAVIAKEKGCLITGSDLAGHFPSDEVVAKLGVTVHEGFSEETILLDKPDLVIYTGAHQGRDNPEVQAAVTNGIEVLPHGMALGRFMQSSRRISVAGCHGKTTTSAMAATILASSGKDPSYAVGCGWITPIGLPGHAGSGEWFVSEADEYITDPGHDETPRFMWQDPEFLCITNIDYDHPDAYKTLDDVKHAYEKLAQGVVQSGTVIVNSDDPNSSCIHTRAKRLTVGRKKGSDWRISHETFLSGKSEFDLNRDRHCLHITLHVPGVHNISNAAMAAVTSLVAGCPEKEIIRGLEEFGGTRRRFEHIATVGKIEWYDDYAHHPHEIEATLSAATTWFPGRRIIAVFEPHTYSRTKALLADFGLALSRATIPIVTDIYASAREHDTLGVTGAQVVSEVAKYNPHAVYKANAQSVSRYLKNIVRPQDIVIFMGAGDIYLWEKSVVDSFG